MLPFGCKFRTIKIQNDNDEILGQVTEPSGSDDFFACAIMCLAGPVAAQKITSIPPEQQPRSRDDLDKARNLLSKVSVRGYNLDLDAIQPFTTMLIDHNWPAVQLIACHLLDRRELTYAKVLGLLP